MQQSEADMEQQTGSKLGKEYIKAVYCHPACLTHMQSTSYEMPGWLKHKLAKDPLTYPICLTACGQEKADVLNAAPPSPSAARFPKDLLAAHAGP